MSRLNTTTRKKRGGGHSLSDHLKSPVSIIRPSIGDSSTLFTKMVTLDPAHPHPRPDFFVANSLKCKKKIPRPPLQN